MRQDRLLKSITKILTSWSPRGVGGGGVEVMQCKILDQMLAGKASTKSIKHIRRYKLVKLKVIEGGQDSTAWNFDQHLPSGKYPSGGSEDRILKALTKKLTFGNTDA